MAISTNIVPNPSARQKLEEISGQKTSLCFQCEKCSNGCPVTFAMDILPHRAMRLLTLGRVDTLLHSNTIWVCAQCETCSTRCPNGIDIAHVMDSLRKMCQPAGVKAAQPDAPLFNEEFLGSIKSHGRVFELKLITDFTIKSLGIGGLVKQARTGLDMIVKGKLNFFPHSWRGNRQVKAIFEATEKKAKQ